MSAVCHGPAGLLDPVGTDGKPLVNGKNVTGLDRSFTLTINLPVLGSQPICCGTGFSNAEEKAFGKEKAVPFLLEGMS